MTQDAIANLGNRMVEVARMAVALHVAQTSAHQGAAGQRVGTGGAGEDCTREGELTCAAGRILRLPRRAEQSAGDIAEGEAA